MPPGRAPAGIGMGRLGGVTGPDIRLSFGVYEADQAHGVSADGDAVFLADQLRTTFRELTT